MMKQFWKDVGTAFTMGMVLPSVLLAAAVSFADQKVGKQPGTEPIFATDPVNHTEIAADQLYISVLNDAGNILEMPLNEYLTGVVLAEMPVSFEEEALKAQAVVARTYTLRAAKGTSKHENAAVCTASGCCQAYVDCDSFLDNGGKAEEINRVSRLIASTDGQVLTYEGSMIEATYFSCSGGVTEDAVAVWGTDVPYLQSVPSPGEEAAAYYTDSVMFSKQELENKLGVILRGAPSGWIEGVTYTTGGGVETIKIAGQVYSGTQFRKLLDLRSTAFSVAADENTITIHTRGYGHRVGMSQYGANAMAAAGSTYPQILTHYYQGAELTTYAD